ncbi:MAG TPA: sugar phosphate nucleotidyltransferase [Chloroflexota bacterium]|nr:sugar phosphate nucleotidyltransferase [Chloroflexota bacterium]
MKVVIPVAGLGTRLRPHTHTKPKPLVQVAGQPVLAYILDQLKELPVDEVIYIVGHLGGQIEEYVRARNDFPSRFIEQKELRGQAHALHLAADAIDQPVLIIFVDTIVKADLATLPGVDADGVLFVQPVEDPRRFGVAVVDNGRVTRLVEKPKQPVSNLAVVGVYYVKDWQLFKRSLQEVIDRDIQTAGEYYLADALQVMIDHGARLHVRDVEVWEDCGTLDAILQTNRWMLGTGYRQGHPPVENSVIVPPVYIAPTARVTNSVIGPNVSIGDGATVNGSLISDSIISDRATLENCSLTASLVGSKAVVRGRQDQVNIGDDAQVEAG